MPQPDWQRLRQDYHAGRFEESGGAVKARTLVFEDGTVWFPEAFQLQPGGGLLLPALGGLWLLGLVATLVTLVDGMYVWLAACGGTWLVITGLLAGVIRSSNKRDDERRSELTIGLFLFDDALVARDADGSETIVARDKVRWGFRQYGNSAGSRKAVHIEPTGGPQVATELLTDRELVERLESWLP